MGRYNVDTEEIQKAAEKLKIVYRELDRASAKITRAYNLIFDLNSVQTRQCASEIKFYGGLYDSQWANVKHIEDALVNICAGLHLTENRAKEMLSDDYELKENEIVSGDWAPAGETENELKELTKDFAQGFLGKCGVTGAVISSVWKVSEDCNGLTILKGVNDVANSGASKVIEHFTKTAEETVKKSSFRDGFKGQIADDIAEFKVKDYGTKTLKNAETTRCITKWAGVVIDGALNLVDNAKEYNGDMSNSRVYEETVVETALSIGMDSVIGAAVTGVIATTVGVGALPGLAVAAIGVGVGVVTNCALDKVSEHIFGNDEGWVENVSDTALNIAHGVHDTVQNVTNNIKDTIGKGFSAMGKCLSTVWAM